MKRIFFFSLLAFLFSILNADAQKNWMNLFDGKSLDGLETDGR